MLNNEQVATSHAVMQHHAALALGTWHDAPYSTVRPFYRTSVPSDVQTVLKNVRLTERMYGGAIQKLSPTFFGTTSGYRMGSHHYHDSIRLRLILKFQFRKVSSNFGVERSVSVLRIMDIISSSYHHHIIVPQDPRSSDHVIIPTGGSAGGTFRVPVWFSFFYASASNLFEKL